MKLKSHAHKWFFTENNIEVPSTLHVKAIASDDHDNEKVGFCLSLHYVDAILALDLKTEVLDGFVLI